MLKKLWFWAFMSIANIAGIMTAFWLMSIPSWIAFVGGVIGILIQITLDVNIL